MPIVANNPGSYGFNVAPTNIGAGYAQGITDAGKSIAGGISGIMGGIGPDGTIKQGILEQNSTVNDMLSQMGQMKNPDGSSLLSKDTLDSIMSKGLGARQQMVGLLTSQIASNMQQQREVAVAQAQAQNQMAQTQYSEQAATERTRIANAANQPVTIVQAPQGPSSAEAKAELARRQNQINSLH